MNDDIAIVSTGNDNSNNCDDVLRPVNALMGLVKAAPHRLIAICPMPIKAGLDKFLGKLCGQATPIPIQQSKPNEDSEGDQVVPSVQEFEVVSENFKPHQRKGNAKYKAYKCCETDWKARAIELEQKNDDLERALRARTFSMEDYESKFLSAIEQIALLETELEEQNYIKLVAGNTIPNIVGM